MPEAKEEKNLDLLMDVKVNVTVRLGSAVLPMKDVLNLSPGSTIRLDQAAGDPVELYINDKKVALGEVVVIEERFGIKILELCGAAQ